MKTMEFGKREVPENKQYLLGANSRIHGFNVDERKL